jgi:hypothetical protein
MLTLTAKDFSFDVEAINHFFFFDKNSSRTVKQKTFVYPTLRQEWRFKKQK